MPSFTDLAFTHSLAASIDGTVRFECSSDIAQWPWLALHPFDPIVVQSINFWASVETAMFRGTYDPAKWSALTHCSWHCGDPGVSRAVRGVSETSGAQETPGYTLTLYDQNDALVFTISGRGVVFQNRDFETWRANAKQALGVPAASDLFPYAPLHAVDASGLGQCFLTVPSGNSAPTAQGLITKENGFPPAHPFLSGSGDHVNTTHIAEVGRQFARLLYDNNRLTFDQGAMELKRFVELNIPFRLTLRASAQQGQHLTIDLHQAERLCATMTLRVQPN